MTWIKVRRSCAYRRPHSLVQNHPYPAAGHGQDGWGQSWMQWMTIKFFGGGGAYHRACSL